MTHRLGTAPGFAAHPDHAVNVRTAGSAWQVWLGDTLLADSANALLVEESGYPPVVYFPPADVRVAELRHVAGTTTCPFKGEASYFAPAHGDADNRVAWTYPVTYDEVAAIAGHIAFYADRVTVRPVDNH